MVSIVIPTYNERENIPDLLDCLGDVLGSTDYSYEVIIVDDDSPDGTWQIASKLSDEHPVRVLRRTEVRGLATAVLAGIRAAQDDVLVVMDADFQHPPEKVPELLSAIETGADIAIGSRFVEGGSVGDFGVLRISLSRGADLLARALFPQVRNVSDIQSGFFALRKETVENHLLEPTGYKILLEILIQGDYEEVTEIGYVFGERKAGESKLGLGTVLDYLKHLGQLYRRTRSSKFSRFRSGTRHARERRR